jgi:hypothetical protein
MPACLRPAPGPLVRCAASPPPPPAFGATHAPRRVTARAATHGATAPAPAPRQRPAGTRSAEGAAADVEATGAQAPVSRRRIFCADAFLIGGLANVPKAP